MSLFLPCHITTSVTDITTSYLKSKNIKAVVLDVDNTLTQHGSQEVKKEVTDWLLYMKENNIPLFIVSNNYHKRVKPFADKLGIEFECFSLKPFKKGLKRAAKRLGFPMSEIALVGDQIYTDVLGGNRIGMYTILVTDIMPENGIFFKLKRYLEQTHIKRYYVKNKGEQSE